VVRRENSGAVRTEEVMTTPAPAVREHVPLAVAAELLARYGYPALPVVDADDCVVGIVGDGDVLVAGIDHRPGDGVTVADVMTTDVLVVALDLEIDQLTRRLVSGGRRLVPVVDAGRLAGVVTRLDLLRLLPARAARVRGPRQGRTCDAAARYCSGEAGGHRPKEDIMSVATNRARPSDPVRMIMSAPVATVDAGDTLLEVAGELLADEVGVVLVSSGRAPVGLLSERDLVAVAAAGDDLAVVQAGEAMTADLTWAPPGTSIREVGLLMIEAGVRHVPIGDGRVAAGVVSVRDVLAVLLSATE
jgi:CBS domain-containing protein